MEDSWYSTYWMWVIILYVSSVMTFNTIMTPPEGFVGSIVFWLVAVLIKGNLDEIRRMRK